MPKVQRREIEDAYTFFPLFSFPSLWTLLQGYHKWINQIINLTLKVGRNRRAEANFFFDINLLYSFHVPTPACT